MNPKLNLSLSVGSGICMIALIILCGIFFKQKMPQNSYTKIAMFELAIALLLRLLIGLILGIVTFINGEDI